MESEANEVVKENVEEPAADVKKDFVMVNMNEVPAANSSEILEIIPKPENEEEKKVQSDEVEVEEEQIVEEVKEPEEVEGPEKESEDVVMETEAAEIQEEVVEEPIQKEVFQPLENEEVIQEVCDIPAPQQEEVQVESSVQSNHAEEIQPTVQSVNPKISEQLPVSNLDKQTGVLNRRFIKNPAFRNDVADSAKQFSVVSYNVLAQCHLERNDYSFTEPRFLAADHRYQKLVTELRYMDGYIVCLQEVEPQFFNNTLMAAMEG